MKCVYVLLSACCLLAVGLAKPATPLINYQDTYGQYSFGYSGPTSARSEFRTQDGVTRGSYSYIDDTGVIRTAQYIADDLGFRIIDTNIPQTHIFLQSPQAIELVQLKAQKLDQMSNQGETKELLKQAERKTDSTAGDKQQTAEAEKLPDTGSASVKSQTRIGETNVFLQQAKGASGEKQLETTATLVPPVGPLERS